MPEVQGSDPLWAGSSRWLEAALGLHFAPRQWPELQCRLDRAASRLGLADACECAQRMLAGRLSRAQRQVLTECLTIGETYFFREPAVFQHLRALVLEPLIAARRTGSRHLRLWSVACSSGEEPYSLAMLVRDLLPDWRDWQVSILATDINESALRKARAGAYGRWSVRGPLPPEARPFLHQERNGGYRIDPELRRMVHFAPLNLASGDHAALVGAGSMDLVLCRNVLIYFEPARVRQVLARLGQTLADGGWLVTTSVEMPREPLGGLCPVIEGGFAALRRTPERTAAPERRSVPAAAARAPAAARPRPRPATPTRAPAAALPSAPAAAIAGPSDGLGSDELAQRAQHCADAGALDEAEALCRRAIAHDGLNASRTYLLASILQERGDLDGAAAALQRTLYLDRRHLLARFALGSLALRRSDGLAARRHFQRALGLLEGFGPQDVVPGSGGLGARELHAIIRKMDRLAP